MLNKRYLGSLLLVIALLLASWCAVQVTDAAEPFTLTSSAFKDGTPLQRKNAGNRKDNPNCVGENVSPPLSWSNPPAGTKSYALTMVDPEGRGGLGVVHWVAYGISVSVTGFAEGEVGKPSDKYVGGKGTNGASIYLGPCTPRGAPHHLYVHADRYRSGTERSAGGAHTRRAICEIDRSHQRRDRSRRVVWHSISEEGVITTST